MRKTASDAKVVAVHRSPDHSFSKSSQTAVRLVAGLGVEGDAHMGATVKHRSSRRGERAPNLRQVHLIHGELFGELRQLGFEVAPGQIGENVTTQGVDLLGLPTGAELYLGEAAVVRVTGLRTPCRQLNRHQKGLMTALFSRDQHGKRIPKAGVMGVVICGGEVRPGDRITIMLPPEPHLALEWL
jgi:MOSC domain-containing protein YiiM